MAWLLLRKDLAREKGKPPALRAISLANQNLRRKETSLSWETPQTLDDLKRDFLDKFAKDLSPQLLLNTAEANRQWLSAEAANELIRLLYFQSLIPGKSIKVEKNHIDTVQDISPQGQPSFAGLRIATLSGYLKATAGVVGIDAGAGISTEIYSYTFAFGDSTPQLVAELPSPCFVIQVSVIVTEAFNGVGATFTVGDYDNNSRLLGAGDIDLTSLGIYLTSPGIFYDALSELNIYLTLGSGASTGQGTVIIYTI